jgi:hypothetical protein
MKQTLKRMLLLAVAGAAFKQVRQKREQRRQERQERTTA